MNAIPKRSQNYKRIQQMPTKPNLNRVEPVNRTESLDARRAAQLAEIRRRELVIQSGRVTQGNSKEKELDYSMAYKHAKVPPRSYTQNAENTVLKTTKKKTKQAISNTEKSSKSKLALSSKPAAKSGTSKMQKSGKKLVAKSANSTTQRSASVSAMPQKTSLQNNNKIAIKSRKTSPTSKVVNNYRKSKLQRNVRVNASPDQDILQRNMKAQSQRQSGTKYAIRDTDPQRRREIAYERKGQVPAVQQVAKAERVQSSAYGTRRQVGVRYQMYNNGGAAVLQQEQRTLIPGFDMYAEDKRGTYGKQIASGFHIPRSKEMVTTILCIALIFAMLVFVLLKYAELSNVTHQNSQIENHIVELKQQVEKIDMDISLKESVSSIQQRAIELEMAYPTAEQIVYISADSGDTSGAVQPASSTDVQAIASDIEDM